jgi:PAS domain S-box-containing protein
MARHAPPLIADRVLIVDDDPGTCETLGDILRTSGYVVQTAKSAQDALAQFEARPCDAAVVDVRLPDASGIDLLHAIKAVSPMTEVIVLTGHASLTSAIQAINGTAFAYLEKPIEMKGLLATLGKAVDRKRAADARLRRERELADFLENATVGIHWMGPDGRILWANRAELELLGYARDEYVGRHVAEVHVDWDVVHDMLERLARNEVLRGYEARLRAADGSIKHVLIDSSVLWEDGKFVHTRCFTHDISKRKQSEEAALALAAVGREMTETLDPVQAAQRVVAAVLRLFHVRRSALYRIDDGDHLRCVAAAGEGSADWVGQRLPVGHGLAGAAVAQRRAIWSPDVQADPAIRIPAWLRERLAAEGLGSAAAVPLADRERILGCLALADTPGRRFAEQDLELLAAFADQATLAVRNALLYEEVRAARDFLRSITENSADTIVTTDRRGRFTYLSPGVEAMFGYRPHELVGQPAADYYRGGASEARELTRRLVERRVIRNYETAVRAKDGRWVPVSTSVSLLRGDGVWAGGTLGVLKDMTQREAAEAGRGELVELRAVATLAAGVAHEIGNPLAVIVGQMELLALSLPDNARARARVDHALEAADEIREIVVRMARITRVKTSTFEAGLPPILDIGESSNPEAEGHHPAA